MGRRRSSRLRLALASRGGSASGIRRLSGWCCAVDLAAHLAALRRRSARTGSMRRKKRFVPGTWCEKIVAWLLPSWRFPPAFWTANVIELCERAAYYGWFIMLAPFLTDVVGYSDIQAGYIGGLFAAFLYLLPFLSGAFADRVGYRWALLLALFLLTLGCGGIGLCRRSTGCSCRCCSSWAAARWSNRSSPAPSRAARMKPVGPRLQPVLRMMVNIGSFLGKTVAKPVRVCSGWRRCRSCRQGWRWWHCSSWRRCISPSPALMNSARSPACARPGRSSSPTSRRCSRAVG